MFISGTLLPLDPVTEQIFVSGWDSKEQIEVTPSTCETTDYASSLISWRVDTGNRCEFASVGVRPKDIHFVRLGTFRIFFSLREVTTSTVMRKREKRTSTWRS